MLRGWRLGLVITLGLGAAGSVPLLLAYLDGYELNSLYRSLVGLWVNAVVIGYIVGWPLFPSWPESNSMGPFAMGYAMPVDLLHGSAHAVIECQVPYPDAGASRFSNVSV